MNRRYIPQRRQRLTTNHTAHPVALAMGRRALEDALEALRTSAGLHGLVGADSATLIHQAGRLCFVTASACGAIGRSDGPDVNILRGMAETLGDLAAAPDSIEQHRPAIVSGLAAIDRLLPDLPDWALAEGALKIDAMLASAHGMTSGDVRTALSGGAAC